MPRLHQHVSRSPVARRHANALSTKAAQIRMALRHHERNFATRSAHTSNHITRYRQSSRSPATRRVYPSMFRAPQWHGTTQRHLPSSLSPAPKSSLPHYICSTNWPGLTGSSKSAAPSLQNQRFVRDFLALDTHDLRRGLPATNPERTLTCISRPRHARSLQRLVFRGAQAAPPPALREKEKKSDRIRRCEMRRCEDEQRCR